MPTAAYAPGRLAPVFRRTRKRGGSTVPPAPAAPDTPSTPSPADAATAYFSLLSWVSARATKFDIYLDTVNPPATVVVPKYVGTSYVPTLSASTTYYWKIVAFNDGGSATGPVWSFTTPAATAVLFNMAGSIVTSRARFGSLRIHDVLGPQPNTASLLFDTVSPTGGETIQIGLGTLDDDDLIFGGEVQSLDQTYVGTPDASSFYPASLIDHTFRINKRRPFGAWTNVSATTIAQYLVATFAPAFTSTHVQENLPAVSINFDGSQDFMTCMKALADAISDDTNVGKTKVDYARDVHLFLTQEEDTESPDPLDLDHPPLNDPSPIAFSVDHSQIRTRVYGKGHGENVPTDVLVGETILPIADAVMFSATGGQAIAGLTAGGAQTEILTYTGVQSGGGGSLVGPGAAPSVAPTATLTAGAGLSSGTYSYAYTDVTAAGESLPSPLRAVVTGPLSPPATAPSGTVQAGGSIEAGTYQYAVSFVTAVGETTAPTASVSVSPYVVPAPASAAVLTEDTDPTQGTTQWAIGDLITVYITYLNAAGETLPSPVSNTITAHVAFSSFPHVILVSSIPVSADPTVTSKRLYVYANGVSTGYNTIAASLTNARIPIGTPTAGSKPVVSTCTVSAVALTGIPIGPSGTTARNVYRSSLAVPTYKLQSTINDNVTTTALDTSAQASLGATAPVTNTANVNQVALSGIATGATGTTQRKVYRTAVNGSQLKLLATIANNTATTLATDTADDATLGANVPTGDTSGLTQPSGQVNAGSTSLLTASAGPFSSTGGWVTLSGGQTVRYTGISTNTLTGIPSSGSGAILTTVLYGTQVLPAPALTGINAYNGLRVAMAKGSAVHIWVQRDDLDAQAALGQLELDEDGNATDGIREFTITDGRFGEALLIAKCDADLAIFSRPIISATYYTRDTKTRSGRTVSIDLQSNIFDPTVFDMTVFGGGEDFGYSGDFTIQSVEIEFDGPALNPRFHVQAASVAFTLSDLLRRVALGS